MLAVSNWGIARRRFVRGYFDSIDWDLLLEGSP